jgi:thiamine monophosphate kinase
MSLAQNFHMGLRSLAEAVILQSMEDLWDERHEADCMTFFGGEGFNICATIAGLKLTDRLRLAALVRRAAGKATDRREAIEHSAGGR